MVELPAVATRVDSRGGYREEFSFALVHGTRAFSVLHMPLTSAHAGLLICPPILMEHLTNYRHEVLLARALASRGVAVQRFHYRGTGHSEGEEREVSMETMVEDALAAARRLQDQARVEQIAFHGTRWGGRVAAAAAAFYPGAPVIFWEPVVDPDRYFRELVRSRLVRRMRDARFANGSSDAWMEEMARQDRVDILGYPLYRRLYEEGRGSSSDQFLVGRGARAVLLVQMNTGNMLRRDLGQLKQTIEGEGGTWELRMIHDTPAWLWTGHRIKSADTLVKLSADWLVENMAIKRQ